MAKEDVLICDRCDTVVRGITKPRDSKSELVVHVRSDLTILKTSIGISVENSASPGMATSVSAEAFEDLCDECRDECAELLKKIFRSKQ